MNNREQYPFLDTLYVDNIVPIVGQCSFDTINAVKKCVEKTPADDALSPYYNETREDYLAGLNQEIKENAISQKKAFVDYIVPAMQVEIDSLLEVDMSEVMSKYSGGFMNWRKLKFWFGTGSDDLKKYGMRILITISIQNVSQNISIHILIHWLYKEITIIMIL